MFGVASLACAYSSSAGELIAARAVLGLAAAVILPLALAVLPVMFTPAERPRAIAIVGGATFLGYPLGPILGGWLLDNFWWGSVFLINVPIVILALAAVTFLMPESRGQGRFRIDVTGVVISSAGLAALTYGLIRAGQDGWSDTAAVATMAAGAVLLALFVWWERLVGQRPGGQPLVDLGLFSSAGFTWGTTLSTMISFALFGLTFAMPQFFLDVRGLDSLASGVRMLPLIGGLAVGLGIGQRLQSPRKSRDGQPDRPPLLGVRPIGAGGFAIMAAALAAGTATSAASGAGFVSAWFAATGLGLGLALPTMLNAALSALSPERSGSGSALMTAARQVGATIGVAVLGTVLASVYRSHLSLAALPPAVAAAARTSVGTGVAVAARLGSAPLLDAVRAAYASGVDVMLWVCAAIALAAAVLAALFLPRQPASASRGAAAAGPSSPVRPVPPVPQLPVDPVPLRPVPPVPLLPVDPVPLLPVLPVPAWLPAVSPRKNGIPPGQNDWHDRGARTAGQPARAEEGQDACRDQGARAPALQGAGLCGDDDRADSRRRRGVAGHVLPVLPDQGRRGAPG